MGAVQVSIIFMMMAFIYTLRILTIFVLGDSTFKALSSDTKILNAQKSDGFYFISEH